MRLAALVVFFAATANLLCAAQPKYTIEARLEGDTVIGYDLTDHLKLAVSGARR